MTFGNNHFQIWRCYWKNGMWEAGEIRDDKNNPNSCSIIQIVEEFHENPYTLQDIYELF